MRLGLVGGASLLAAWPLWHVTRFDTTGCRSGIPCDPHARLPFAPEAAVLTFVGLVAILVTVGVLGFALIRAVIRYDGEERLRRSRS
jgi:hypothetical protein